MLCGSTLRNPWVAALLRGYVKPPSQMPKAVDVDPPHTHTEAGASCPIRDPRSYTQATTRLITSIYYKGLWEFSADQLPNTFLLETLEYCGQDLFSTSLQHWGHTQPRETGMAW